MSLFQRIFWRKPEDLQKQNCNRSYLEHSQSKPEIEISLLKHWHAWRRRVTLKPNRKETPSYASILIRNTGILRRRFSASYTVEASVVLPVFAVAMAVFIFFLQALAVQWQIQRALEDTSRLFAVTGCYQEYGDFDLAVYAYMTARLKEQQVPVSRVIGGSMNYVPSSADDNYVDLKVHYWIYVPTQLFGSLRFRVIQEAKNRKWVGYDPSESAKDSAYVYITPYGSVYHVSAGCPYLNPSIQSVSLEQAEQMRNQDGGKYYVCGECGERVSASPVVYITAYGDAYHKALDCSGLKRTVYRVPADSVNGYAPCGKCGG